jgi:hypothetical protein
MTFIIYLMFHFTQETIRGLILDISLMLSLNHLSQHSFMFSKRLSKVFNPQNINKVNET